MTASSEKACQKRSVKDEEALTFAAGQSGVRIYDLLIDGEEAFTFVAGESGEGLLLPLQGEFTLASDTQGDALGYELVGPSGRFALPLRRRIS